jgi:hypothetical protein
MRAGLEHHDRVTYVFELGRAIRRSLGRIRLARTGEQRQGERVRRAACGIVIQRSAVRERPASRMTHGARAGVQ